MSICPLCESEIDVTTALKAIAKTRAVGAGESQILAQAVAEIEKLRASPDKPISLFKRLRRK